MEHSLNIPKERQIPPLYKYTAKAFLWMFLGLLATGFTGLYVYGSGLAATIAMNRTLPFALAGLQLFLVIMLSRRIQTLSVGASRSIFIAYSVLTGVTFSSLGYMYEIRTIFIAFLFTSVLFACLSVIGFTTKKDMTSFRPLLLGGLVALILVNIIGIFMNLAAFDLLIGLLGLLVFFGLTVYDTQKMKRTYTMVQNDHMMLEKLSIFFALQLYLDFINMFLYLLRIMGRRN
jgi:hypothetical protein